MPYRQDSANVGGYKEAEQNHAYSYDTGVAVCPVASRTAAHRIIRLHGGIGMRRVSWTASRTGNPPIVPTMADTTGDTFLSGTIVPELPRPSLNGRGYDWTVSGEYVYVQDEPRIAGTHAFPVGQHPYICFNQAAEAQQVMGDGALDIYTAGGFQALMTAGEESVTPTFTGAYTWPLLGLPTVFTSTAILQD